MKAIFRIEANKRIVYVGEERLEVGDIVEEIVIVRG